MEEETPAPEEVPQTLAAGELVWAKTKGRHHWWPARLRDACPAVSSRGALVSCFGDADADADPPRRATQLRGFADPAADGMARATRARGFLEAVEEAQARAVAILQRDLACSCASPPPPPGEVAEAAAAETEVGSVGVANLAPSEFLAFLREAAALDVSSVGLVDRVRLKSWVRAVAQGWGPDGAGHYPRRSVDDLVDKIDLDVVPAVDDSDAADWVAGNEDKAPGSPQETPAQKRRSVASLMEELDAGEDDDQKDESGGPGTGLSAKRERKKSKYLSPPYTNLGGIVLVEKPADLPKELLPSAAKDEKKVLLLDNVGAREVLLLVRCFGKDVFHKSQFPKAAKEFLSLLRNSTFVNGADHESYKEHKCPEENGFAKAGADVAALVSGSCVALKQGKGPLKSRKKDQDGSGGSSIKRKKMEKISPTATLGCGVSITPAIPIRQVRAEDIRSQVKAGGDARGIGVGVLDQKNKLVFKSPISAAMSGAVKPGRKQGQANDGSVLKTPVNAGDALRDQSAKKNDVGMVEATKSETDIQVDMNVQSVIVDVPVKSVQMEATKLETDLQVDMNVRSVIVDVPVKSVQMEAMELEPNIPVDTNEQSVATDVPVRSGSLPTHGDISHPADGNKDNASVEVRTVQESYASLKALVPEMLKKAEEVTTGRNVIATSHVLKDEGQKGEQPNQTKTADEAIANHSPGKATNGTCHDRANSTHKKKKKRAQKFANPAEILLDFANGVVLPSKEELLSAFCKFGFLIESETDILKDTRSARVVFGKSAEAEAAYTKREILGMFGQFGPPFATLKRLNYLPPIMSSIPSPSPASKPPLADIRKNLENMISSLTGHSPLKKATSSAGPKPVSENLLGQMQGLLSKVDKMLAGPSSSTSTPP